MKKIIMLLVASCVTVAAQAASVNWVVSNVYTPTSDVLAPGSTGGGSKMATTADLIISVFWDANKGSDEASWTLISDSATLTAAGTKASSVLWNQDTAVANRNDDGAAFFKVVLEYTDSANNSYTVEKLSGAVDLKNITSQAKSVTFNMNNLAWSGGGTQPDVPEPTSALLLLMGGAMLALRRKRA